MKRYIKNLFKILFALLIMGWSSNAYALYSGGSGTSGDPYQIATLADLGYLSENSGDWGYYFIQTANIDASATSSWNPGPGPGFIPAGFSPIGNSLTYFTGAYDGQNHTISNLYIDRPATDDIGLFGNAPGAFPTLDVVVKNLGLLGVNISGHDYVGAIGGEVLFVENCYATGSVSGNDNVGGIAGFILISNKCYSTCSVAGNNVVGGFCGYNLGNIYNCYATGNVTGTSTVGGFVGQNDVEIKFCYSTGSVTGTTAVGGLVGLNNGGTVENDFWNTETSGQATSDGGTGKTTAEMKRVGNYLSDISLFLPWDFTLSGNIWGFNGADNNGYPFLRYENYTPRNIWLGSASTAWTTIDNWSENVLPDSPNSYAVLDRVFIPDVFTDPVISTAIVLSTLKIEVGGILTIAPGGQLTVSLKLTNDQGASGLILESGASLIHITPGVIGTVGRNIADDNKWHFLSCPINQATMPEICDGNFAPIPGDFNSTTGATYDFFYWNEITPFFDPNWINLKKADWNVNTVDFGSPPRFVKGKGYLVEYSSTYLGSTEKTFTGTLGVGSIVIPVTNTAGGNSYNLIGNSYPSSIDWKAPGGWGRAPLEDNAGGKDLWIWNDAAGNYGVYNSALPGDAGTNGVSRYIAPEQGFFVKATTNGNVTMDDNVRCHSTQAWLKSDDKSFRINVTSAMNSYSDEVMLEFGYLVTGGAEKWFSMYAEAPGLYLPVDETNYSLRFLNEVLANPAIPLSFKAGQDGNYTFTVTGTDAFPNVILQDMKTGSTQDLKTNPIYKFSSLTIDDVNRFMLRFTPLGVDPKQSGHDNIFVYNNVLNVNNPGVSIITIYNMMGTKILEKQTNNESLYQLPLQIPTGYYLVKVTNGNVIYSQKVFIK